MRPQILPPQGKGQAFGRIVLRIPRSDKMGSSHQPIIRSGWRRTNREQWPLPPFVSRRPLKRRGGLPVEVVGRTDQRLQRTQQLQPKRGLSHGSDRRIFEWRMIHEVAQSSEQVRYGKA